MLTIVLVSSLSVWLASLFAAAAVSSFVFWKHIGQHNEHCHRAAAAHTIRASDSYVLVGLASDSYVGLADRVLIQNRAENPPKHFVWLFCQQAALLLLRLYALSHRPAIGERRVCRPPESLQYEFVVLVGRLQDLQKNAFVGT